LELVAVIIVFAELVVVKAAPILVLIVLIIP
jgi:hypothetical protein